jgi:Fe-Mn family superoxide dismutase
LTALAEQIAVPHGDFMNPDHTLTRRDALKTMGAGAALVGLSALGSRALGAENAAEKVQPFTLPKLGYAFDALEPHIDARTMEIHYTKHHQAYITNANTALKDYPDLQSLSAMQILQRLPQIPEKVRTALRNNVGGHANHTFFWSILAPQRGAGAPDGAFAAAIDRTFGSLDAFKTQFADAAGKRFGSGWAWLSVKDGKLAIESTANQDSVVSEGATPVLGLDVWEHAYYLKYQNLRGDYVKAFWNVVNWPQVAAHYVAAMS